METIDELLESKKYKLEVWKVLISILTPIVLVALTYVVNNSIQDRGEKLKREEQVLSEKQRIYSELGKKLNVIYIYAVDIGDFGSYSPPEIIKIKREADRQFYMYLPYWSENSKKLYEDFTNSAFQPYGKSGSPAKIRATKTQKMAAFEFEKRTWDSSWDNYFSTPIDPEIADKYFVLVSSLLSDTVNFNIRDSVH